MALAILEFITFEKGRARFSIDTGTNGYYKLKIGKQTADRNGIDWVDEVTHTTPLQKGSSGEDLLGTSKEIALPASYFDRDNCYVQLFSFKNPEGKSPAFSRVIKVPVGFKNAIRGEYLLSLSKTLSHMTTSTDFNTCRQITNKDAATEYASQESFVDDLLSGIKIAAPIVLQILSAVQNGGANNKSSDAPAANQSASTVPAGMINSLLNTLLHGFSGGASLNAGTLSTQNSYTNDGLEENRFTGGGNTEFAHPFIFGIDDALLATLAGPIIQQGLQMLPQLLNSMNQKKLQSQAATNKLMTDLVSETNRRMLLQQLLQNQSSGAAAQNPNIGQLMQLLQQAAASAPAAAPVAAPAETATAQSTDMDDVPNVSTVLSTRAMAVFDLESNIGWNGIEKAVFSKNNAITLNIKLNVPEPAPKNPLPKAIIHFYFKETDSQKLLFQKIFKQKNIAPNTSLPFLFTKEEIMALPLNRGLMVYTEVRWLTASNKEVKVLGSAEVVLVNNYFVKEQGKEVSAERELTDMKVYRSFWNKIWEAPVLDASTRKSDGVKKYSWALDANLKYTFLLTADHDSNGQMDTKLLKAADDRESMTDKTEGRMKSGTEISINELNKLCSLWDNQALLTDEKLSALKNAVVAKNNTSEFIYHVKLKGKAGERGMVWVIPVLKLVSFTLNKIKTTNASGQVTGIEEEIIQFPFPVSARIIGLKSA